MSVLSIRWHEPWDDLVVVRLEAPDEETIERIVPYTLFRRFGQRIGSPPDAPDAPRGLRGRRLANLLLPARFERDVPTDEIRLEFPALHLTFIDWEEIAAAGIAPVVRWFAGIATAHELEPLRPPLVLACSHESSASIAFEGGPLRRSYFIDEVDEAVGAHILHLRLPDPPRLWPRIEGLVQGRFRLIVLEVQSTRRVDLALWIAHHVAEAGGPPVVIIGHSTSQADAVRQFYASLLEGEVVSAAVWKLQRTLPELFIALCSGPRGDGTLPWAELVASEPVPSVRADDAVGAALLTILAAGAAVLFAGWAARQEQIDADVEAMRKLRGQPASVRRLEALRTIAERVGRQGDEAREYLEQIQPLFEDQPRQLNLWLGNDHSQHSPSHQLHVQTWYDLHLDIGPSDWRSVLKGVELPPEIETAAREEGGLPLWIAVQSATLEIAEGDETSVPDSGRWSSISRELHLPPKGPTAPLRIRIFASSGGLHFARIIVRFRFAVVFVVRVDLRVDWLWSNDADARVALPELHASLDQSEIVGLHSFLEMKVASAQVALNLPRSQIETWRREARELARRLTSPLEQLHSLESAHTDALHAMRIWTPATLAELTVRRIATAAGKAGVPVRQVRRWVATAQRLQELAGFEAVLEYSTVEDLGSIENTVERTVSLLVNDINGQNCLAIYGANGEAHALNCVSSLVEKSARDLHQVLEDTATNEKAEYRFGTPADTILALNEGVAADVDVSLPRLARHGAKLYTELFIRDPELKIQLRDWLKRPQTLSVVRVGDGPVIPWSMVYDEKVQPKGELTLCTKYRSDWIREPVACREQKGCPLDAATGRDICPFAFWGFKHRIEVPAKRIQQPVATASARELVTEMHWVDQVDTTAHLSHDLDFAVQHARQIDALPSLRLNLLVTDDTTKMDEVLEALGNDQLQLIYFYCHGSVENDDGIPKHQLWFGSPEQCLDAYEIAGPGPSWPLKPIILLNGCGTGQINPARMLSLAESFTIRGAAGIVGTDVPVWEPLAYEVGRFLMEGLLQGFTIGDLILLMRRDLLARHNPLGLVYVVYGSADLKFVQMSSEE